MPADNPTVIEFSIEQNLLQAACHHLLETARHQLPDLRSTIILLPDASACTPLRLQLLDTFSAMANSGSSQHEPTALFPPWTGTLKEWITQHIFIQHKYSLISEQARRLVFIDALKDFPDVFKEENKWQVTIALLKLFDELSLQKTRIADAGEWQQRIEEAYGIREHPHCNQEAEMVYQLWQAWQQQLHDNEFLDITGDYISRLQKATQLAEQKKLPSPRADSELNFIVIGDQHLSQCEQDFLSVLQAGKQCTIIKHKTLSPEDDTDDINRPVTQDLTFFIQQCFAGSNANNRTCKPIQQRANEIAANTVESIPFSCFLATDDEIQVRAVELQIRQWLLRNVGNIGIVCEDRKLSRRLRALLDRADVAMQDQSGWSLATTQAATIIERWLQCIEEDFDSRPMLECLKSPFVAGFFESGITETETFSNEQTPETLENGEQEKWFKYLIYRFEHDIILHENTNSSLSRYRDQLARRKKRLRNWSEQTCQGIISIINQLDTIAAPLLQLYQNTQTTTANQQPASSYFFALKDALEKLDVLHAYAQDAAGLRILQTLDDLENSLQIADPLFSWQDFRLWLGNALEEKLFSAQTQSSQVKLMSINQAETIKFDALIIAAVEPNHFPGKAGNSPFFNQAVRQSLGLPCWQQQYRQKLEKFQQLLFAAPEILLTCKAQDNGEDIPVSPWLELLIQFHELAFSQSPLNQELTALLEHNTEVFRCDTDKLPEAASRPAPSLQQALIPERFSASSHQRLINCPYQFFCGDGLKLKPLEEISTELNKADYGERIHQILQCFHSQDDSEAATTKKAFKEPITEHNRLRAEQHLSKLSEQFFEKDLEQNVLHHSWLQRWLKHIPDYITWQIKHQRDWQVIKTEQQSETELENGFLLYGRLDRIDQSRTSSERAIIDYKTGQSARQKDIESGEDVQLTSYSLLEESCAEVLYLSLDSSNNKVKTGASLQGEVLQDYRQRTRQRLETLIADLQQQKAMPAWGDKKVCQHCRFSGICRRQQWYETETS